MQQLPPHSREAEEAVLGSLLIDPDAVFMVSDFLSGSDFYLASNKVVYDTILDLGKEGEPVDLLAASDYLDSSEPRSESWAGHLSNLVTRTPTSINVKQYAKIVTEKATRRRMLEAAGKMAGLAHDESGDITQQLDESEQMIFKVRGDESNKGILKPRQYTTEYLDYLEAARDTGRGVVGIPTGFADLDRILSGIQAPHQYVLAARPGMGKSALAVNIAINAAIKREWRAVFFSLEMSMKQIMNRAVCYLTNIPSDKIQKPWLLTGPEKAQVYDAIGTISDGRLHLDATPGLSPSQIRAKCMRLHAEHGLDLIIIDHLHIMRPDKPEQSRALEYGEMTQTLAELGKTIGAPIITIAQLNRGVDSRNNKRPILSDLRESGRIEENAYAVMFLYRDDYYEELSERPGIAEVVVAKHREGPTGSVELVWRPNAVSFGDLSREMARMEVV